MSQPAKYTRSADFTKNHGSVQNDSLLNAEFDNVATTVNGLRTRQAILLKDDETVANGIIGLDNLTDALKNSLDTTVTDSALALETAYAAKEESDQAIADSATAVTTANQASTKADTALSTANDANTKSNNAVSTANSASTTANTAKETAESVVDQYNTAISTANSAVTTAGNAANTANSALETANAASTTATEAKTIATNAQTIATNYSAEIINYEAKIDATVATIPTQIDEGIDAKDIPGIVEEEVEKQIIVKQDITASKIITALGYTPANDADLTAEETARASADTTLQENITAEAKARADADTALQTNIDNIGDNLATVATSGKYSDLTGTPTLATVATSGKYSDLSGTPSLATVATSGSYNDLSNKPTIPTVPTNISAFTNDTGYALDSDLSTEESTRSSADETLQKNIDAVSTVANTALANTLPPQTGNADKFLTTDGTSASWASVPSDDTKADASALADYLPLAGGTMTGQISLYGDADMHNSVWRGKYLGSSITSAQSSAIKAGTFDDLYIGDYWTIGGINYRIAAIDYYYNTGDTSCTTHHVVVVPDTQLYTAKMNASNTTEGAYVGSEMYKSNLATAQSTITSAFGSAHLLTIRQHFQNAVANACASSGAWYDATIWLMSEVNVYGCRFFNNVINGTNFPNLYQIDNRQYPLFALGKVINRSRQTFWLRDVVNASYFAYVCSRGLANRNSASDAYGVRPAFCVI